VDIAETSDKILLRAALSQDLAGTFYMAADLEPPFFEKCRWLVEMADGAATGVMLIYFGLQTPSLLVWGEQGAIRRILHRYRPELPARFCTKLTKAQMEVFRGDYRFSCQEELDVMMLVKETRPQMPHGVGVRLLSPADLIEPILNVYRDYPGNFFEPSQLQAGLYAGAWVNGELAAIAGTHAYAPAGGLAVLGNIATAARFRGQGIGKAVTAFLCDELKKRNCTRIGLHVTSGNAAAIACYLQCGFAKDRNILQMVADKGPRGDSGVARPEPFA
jgi:ribosomal protein S18 acetylase RimI-like enzyme